MPTSYQFLPWVRRGLTVALGNVDTMGALPAHATAQVGVKLAGAFAGEAIPPIAMQLYGPGDVVAIDTALVVRTDPRRNATNFEPNYLAIVDFDPPDFPWMLTPASATATDRLRPWLVLVVLEVANCGVPKMKGQAPLPQIRVPAALVETELPPLGESWSWAHAQVVSDSASDNVAGIQAELQGDPRSNVSRLVCPRRLSPRTDYVACVVPAFEPGRLRGLGLAGDGSGAAMQTLAPAWDTAVVADVTLPVYYHWEFSTSDAGDFESLARRLRTPKKWKNDAAIQSLLANIGTAPMAVDPLINPAAVSTKMEGALVPLSYTPGAPAIDTHADSLMTIVNTPASQVDNPVVDEPGGQVKRIEVKPPLWGNWHAKKHSVTRADEPGLWLAGLNLNPRYRGAAGHGAEVVRKNQEAYVDACWGQIGTIRDAELKFNLTRLAIEAQRALKAKHFDPLPPERLLQVMGPALPRIEALNAAGQPAFKVNGVVASLGGQVDRSSMPAAMVDGALRRSASPLRRGLRGAALRQGSATRLPDVGRGYMTQMAAATTKGAAFNVNAYVPDGILGTTFFDGLQLDGQTEIDLSGRGMRGLVGVAQVRAVMAAASAAQVSFARHGMPQLRIRPAQHGGVFTDLHIGRFAALAAQTTTLKAADFGAVALQVESASRRGVEGFLVEAQLTGGQLQISAMQLDKRSGALRLDKPLARLTPRGAVERPRAGQVRAIAGIPLAQVNLADVRLFGNVGLFSSLPPNAFDLQAGNVVSGFKLTDGLEFTRLGDAPPQRNVTSITLPPALRKRDVLNRFSKATQQLQKQWLDPFDTMRVAVQTVDFPLAAAAQIVRARTQPDLTLAARLVSQVQLAGTTPGTVSAFVGRYLLNGPGSNKLRFMVPALFDRVMAWPHLRAPLYRDLAEMNQEAFMPGIGNLPPDLIMAVQVNQFFIDSFMVGANAEMNRELLWRGFPTDLRGTPFQRFWGRVRSRADGTQEPLDDMEPIHEWGRQPLGQRVDENLKDPNRIALLVKGQLLRRYPNTAVYAWKRRKGVPADASKLVKNAQGLPPNAAAIQTPVFSGAIDPDITFFGFDIDREAIDDWCFVIEEHMTEPRFGFDVDEPPAPPVGGGGGVVGTATVGKQRRPAMRAALQQYALGNAATPEFLAIKARGYNPYKALSWSHLGVADGQFTTVAALSNVPNAPFASFPTLTATPTAAEIAKALLQEPFRAYWEGPDLKT
jgi:hypothetical protein